MKIAKLVLAGIGILFALCGLLKWLPYAVALPVALVVLTVLFFINGYEAYRNQQKILCAIYTLAAVCVLGMTIAGLF